MVFELLLVTKNKFSRYVRRKDFSWLSFDMMQTKIQTIEDVRHLWKQHSCSLITFHLRHEKQIPDSYVCSLELGILILCALNSTHTLPLLS